MATIGYRSLCPPVGDCGHRLTRRQSTHSWEPIHWAGARLRDGTNSTDPDQAPRKARRSPLAQALAGFPPPPPPNQLRERHARGGTRPADPGQSSYRGLQGRTDPRLGSSRHPRSPPVDDHRVRTGGDVCALSHITMHQWGDDSRPPRVGLFSTCADRTTGSSGGDRYLPGPADLRVPASRGWSGGAGRHGS